MNGRKKILIVDDDPEITAALADHLQERGYQVLTAARGEQGIELAKESDPDLIVLDVGLPDTSGYEVCQILRNISSCRHTPIIMLTAHSEIQDEVEGLKSGADDYIPKPFKSARLLARIETLIGRNSRRLDANALTHLPGNVAIQDEIQSRIRSQGPYAVL
ncbi:MAG: response regulator transcription factor, partial [Elusimicrobia bacterium]|nr:response regulator transcription factor [Candidatus Obscuribacterium magneticum]